MGSIAVTAYKRLKGDVDNIVAIDTIRTNLTEQNYFASITLRESLKRLTLQHINELYPIDFKRKIVFYIVKWLL